MTELIETLQGFSDNPPPLDSTEADIRATVLDPVLDVCGWRKESIKREPYAGWKDAKGFIDYLLLRNGKPFIVIEAKKVGRSFDVPDSIATQGNTSLKKLRAVASKDLIEAIDQCIRYTDHCGAIYACATNGLDFIFFKPYHIHRSQPDAKVVVFRGYDDILRRLDEFEDLLSFSRTDRGSAEKALVGRELRAPDFAKRLGQTFPYNPSPSIEAADFATILDGLIRNFLLEIRDPNAFERCYVRVAWTRTTNDAFDALLRNQLKAFTDARQESRPDQVLAGMTGQTSLAGNPFGRTVVLHGAIGVGKTSFLRQLPNTVLKKQGNPIAEHLVWAHLDLLDFRDRPLTKETAADLTERICSSLRDHIVEAAQRHERRFDPDAWHHLRDIYNKESRSFQKQRFPDSSDDDEEYLRDAREYIWNLKEADPQEHLIRVLFWLTETQKVPVVLVLDNSDQLGLEFQELLYTLALGIQRRTSAITLLALRTSALASHRLKENALANVEDRYEVQRAPLVEVLGKRLTEMKLQLKNMVEGNDDPNIKVAVERLEVLLETLAEEFRDGTETAAVVRVAGNGNLRRTMEAVGHVFKIDPKAMDRLVEQQYKRGRARLQPGFVLKAIMRAGNGRYKSDSVKCLIPNLAETDATLKSWHELTHRILRQIRAKASSDSAPTVKEVVADFALAGVDPRLAERVLERLRRRQLITLPHMLSDMYDEDTVRLTELGVGMLDTVRHYTEYIDGILWDTLIYDQQVFTQLAGIWRNRKYDNFRETFLEMRDAFVAYLEADQARFQEAIQVQFFEAAAREQLPLDFTRGLHRA